jgi:DNA polymerase-4
MPPTASPQLLMPRLIAHLDMDAFYAAVELLRRPDLRGRPVVIGGSRDALPVRRADGTWRYATLRHYAGRGVVTTATYEARAFGVHSAMGMMKAARLAPDAVLLPVDFDAYRACSRRFKAAVRAVAPVVEDRGIDEIYVDLTDVPGAQADAGRAVGQALKDAVRAATGLTCSVGITPNKLLSKLCSEFDKPDGLTLLDASEIAARVWPLPARRINGIGPKANARLEALGIVTIGDLAAADVALLAARFGANTAAWLHDAAHGRDDRPVVTHSEPKGISRETTFERDLHAVRDRAELSAVFTRLCEKLAADLERKGYAARSIGIKLRYDDFRIVTRDLTLAAPTCDARTIRRAAGECLKRVDLARRLRLLGVRGGALVGPADAAREDAARPAAGAACAAPAAPAGRAAADASHHASLPLFDDPPAASR